jgi:hypothetical protein
MKYLVIHHDGNGNIREKDITIEDFSDRLLENSTLEFFNEIIAVIPIAHFKQILPSLNKAVKEKLDV